MSTHWAIVRSRSTKWYHVSRVVEEGGAYWEMYWHAETELRGPNKAAIRALANANGLALLDGVFQPSGNEMNRLALCAT